MLLACLLAQVADLLGHGLKLRSLIPVDLILSLRRWLLVLRLLPL